MAEAEGALPVSVDYRVFRDLYIKLHTGIQAGLSDVVSNVFAKGLITLHTKSVAENLAVAAPSRVSTLLDALLHRIKTNTETFDIFADVLKSIDSFSYLAEEMMSLKAQKTEEERKRMEDLQEQKNQQIEKRRGLQLSVDPLDLSQTPPSRNITSLPDSSARPITVLSIQRITRTPDSLPSMSSSHLETNQSPMCSLVRDIQAPPINSPARVISTGISPVKFIGSATPPPSSLSLSNLSQLSLTENSQSSITLQSLPTHQEEVFVKSNVVAVVTDASSILMAEPPFPVTTATPSSNSESDSCNSDTRERTPPSLPLDSVPVKSFSHEDSREEEAKITTSFLSSPPAMVTTTPTPGTEDHTFGVQPLNTDGDKLSAYIGLKLSGSFQNLRTDSVESSVSTDVFFSAPTSLVEDEVNPAPPVEDEENVSQESEDSHDSESLVGAKLYRSISCEKCATEKLKDAERTIARLQLETSRLQAAYESKTKKLLEESSSLQSEIFELKCSLRQHQAANEELQVLHNKQCYAKFCLEAENRQLRAEVREVKSSAYDRVMALERERSKTHRCPNCCTEFYYPSNR